MTFTATSNLAQPSYEWDLNGEGTYGATGSTIGQSYLLDGPRTVTLRATDAATGQSVVVAHALTVNALAPMSDVARVVQTDLALLMSPIGRAILGPEHDQPLAPAGPAVIPVLPRSDHLPVMRLRAPRTPCMPAR